MVKKRTNNKSLILSEIAGQLDEQATYQAKLQAAVFDGVTEGDVAEIVKGIVTRAKEGDPKAVDQMFQYVMGTSQNVKLTQNNYYGDEDEEFHAMNGHRGTL